MAMTAEERERIRKEAVNTPLRTMVKKKLGHVVGMPPGLVDFEDPLFRYLPGAVNVCVEIGTLQGWFAHRLAKFTPEHTQIFCIDPFVDDPTEGYDGEYNFKCWRKNVKPWFGKKVFLKKGASFDEGEKWGDGVPIDFLFIDGDHRFESVLLDLKIWVPKVRPGGLVMGHDITGPWGAGVKKAIETYAQEVKGLPEVHVGKVYSFTGKQTTECFWWYQA